MKSNEPFLQVVSHEIAINLNVFGAFMEYWVSQKTEIGNLQDSVSSPNNLSNQTNSPTTFLIALYSASADDKDIVVCFFDFQPIGLSPRNSIYPLKDSLESEHAAQSESQYAVIVQSARLVMKIPWLKSFFKYLNT